MLDLETLRDLLRYDAESGNLYWMVRHRKYFRSDGECKRWNNRYAGHLAFSIKPSGYFEGMIFRKQHKGHRVAWALHYGEWPDGLIDHINGIRTDNRISNLRVVTSSENCRNGVIRKNNPSGVSGVWKCGNRWRAGIHAEGRQIHLGLFKTLPEAAAARKQAEARYGYHPNHGRAQNNVRWSEPEREAA